jgi:L-ascorbate metabolism protein UlaG (beta-lactamase superfamily)
MATLTWLGHASFRLDTNDGKRIYVDPFLSGPTFPDAEKEIERADAIYVTHGHGDHSSDAIDIARKVGCKVLGMVELVEAFTPTGCRRSRRSRSTRAARSTSTACGSR